MPLKYARKDVLIAVRSTSPSTRRIAWSLTLERLVCSLVAPSKVAPRSLRPWSELRRPAAAPAAQRGPEAPPLSVWRKANATWDYGLASPSARLRP